MNRELFLNACLRFVGLPYRWGGDDPINGFDCSGLVQELYAMLGIAPVVDMTAQGLYDHFTERARPGTRGIGVLQFYGKSAKQITHVALMIGPLHVIEAGGGGSKTMTQQDAANQNAYVRIRPWNHRKDIVAIVIPKDLPW